MEKLKKLVKMYTEIMDLEKLLKGYGIDIWASSGIVSSICDFFAEEIAEYSPDYSYHRWHPIGDLFKDDTEYDCDWFPEYIYALLDKADNVNDAVEEILDGERSVRLAKFDRDTRKLIKQIEIANENRLIFEKLLAREEDTNPISDKARHLADRVDSNRKYVDLCVDSLKRILGDQYETAEHYLNCSEENFKSALK